MLILLAVAFAAGAPLAALASGAWTHAIAQRRELARAASRRQVTATVLQTPALPGTGAWDLASVTQARWTAPDGAVVTAQLVVPPNASAGATFRVRATRDGQVWQATGPRWTARA